MDEGLSMGAMKAWRDLNELDDDSSKWIELTWQECLKRHNRAVRAIVHIFGVSADELIYWEHLAYTAGFNAALSSGRVGDLEESRAAYLKKQREY